MRGHEWCGESNYVNKELDTEAVEVESFLQNTLSFKLFSIFTSKSSIKKKVQQIKKWSRKEVIVRNLDISFDFHMYMTVLSL